jgi:hypothetical protein
MSDYTEVSFFLSNKYSKKELTKYIEINWDAFSIKESKTQYYPKEGTSYNLVISELRLTEAIPILDKIKKKYNTYFFIEYGLY